MGIIVKKLIQTVQGKKTFPEFFLCFPHCQRTDHTVDRGNIRQGKFTGIRYIVIPGILYFLVPQILPAGISSAISAAISRAAQRPCVSHILFNMVSTVWGLFPYPCCTPPVSAGILNSYDISQKHFLVPEQRFLVKLHPVSFSQPVAPGQKKKLKPNGDPRYAPDKADQSSLKG